MADNAHFAVNRGIARFRFLAPIEPPPNRQTKTAPEAGTSERGEFENISGVFDPKVTTTAQIGNDEITAAILAERFGLAPAVARLVCGLAGIGRAFT